MAVTSTTRMSSRGQVVIPEAIRKQLGLEPGVQFVVVASKDAVVLKTITPPSPDEFKELLADARKQTRPDVAGAERRGQPGEGIDALLSSDFVGCAEGPEDLASRYKWYLTQDLEEKHDTG